MKRFCFIASLVLFSLSTAGALPQSEYAVRRAEEQSSVKDSQQTQRKERKMERFAEKWDKRVAKAQQKNVKKTGAAKEVWDDGRFRLGIILLVAALALGILSVLISLAGLINFIAGLLALAGIVLIVWSLVEYYV